MEESYSARASSSRMILLERWRSGSKARYERRRNPLRGWVSADGIDMGQRIINAQQNGKPVCRLNGSVHSTGFLHRVAALDAANISSASSMDNTLFFDVVKARA
jgi:hypothetical protein